MAYQSQAPAYSSSPATVAAEVLYRRYAALKALRQPHERVWLDCYDYSYPLRGHGIQSRIDAQQAQAKRAELQDGTATDAARTLASSIMSGLTPANSRWFSLDIGGNENDLSQRWLTQAAELLWENIHLANFDAAAFDAVLDVILAGWSALYVDEDRQRGGLVFQHWPLGGLYCASSRQDGRVDTVYRCYMLSAEQAASEFGAALHADTLKLAEQKPDEQLEFLHVIQPRNVRRDGGRLAKNLPIASYHIEAKHKRLVRESGYHEMPVIVPRWMVIPETCYGVGPMSDALPDVKMLNELKRMEHAAADIAIAGMWIAEDDGVLNPRTIKVGPRKIIVANSVDSMKPLQTGSNFQLSEVLVEQLQKAIRKTLMADQLQPQDGPAMTATEVHVRVGLIRQLLGPLYGRMQAEYLQPLIERCFGLAYRAGVFRQAPESLAGREFSVKYLSPLARAQKLEDVSAMDRFEASLAVTAQAQPDVLDNYDLDKASRHRAKLLGVPDDIMRDQSDVEQRRKERAQAQQQAAQQEQQQTMAMEAMKQRGQAA